MTSLNERLDKVEEIIQKPSFRENKGLGRKSIRARRKGKERPLSRRDNDQTGKDKFSMVPFKIKFFYVKIPDAFLWYNHHALD